MDSLSPFSISYSHQDPGVSDRQPSEALEGSFHDIRLACSQRRMRSWSRARFPSHHGLLFTFISLRPRVMMTVATSSSLCSPPACKERICDTASVFPSVSRFTRLEEYATVMQMYYIDRHRRRLPWHRTH